MNCTLCTEHYLLIWLRTSASVPSVTSRPDTLVNSWHGLRASTPCFEKKVLMLVQSLHRQIEYRLQGRCTH